MIILEKALNYVKNTVDVLSSEQIFIYDAINRVVLEDIFSTIDMPRFNKSAMDGYAFKSKPVNTKGKTFKCIGIIGAGTDFNKDVKDNECVKIMTGAKIPISFDTVVMKEDVEVLDDIYIKITKDIKKGSNVCKKAEDIKKGQKLLKKGTIIFSSHISLLASVGRKKIKVIRNPKVAIINTGDEIIDIGKKLTKNKIYNSNGPQIMAMLEKEGINYSFFGIVNDNIENLKNIIKQSFEYNIVVFSGGVSKGDYDYVPNVLENLGVKKIFHNVKIKPGKPLFFGKKKKTIFLGIPGNPVSNFLAYYMFIRSSILKMKGYKNIFPIFLTGILKKTFNKNKNRRQFVLVRINRKDSLYELYPIKSNGSADIFSLSKADGFMVVPENSPKIKQNSKVEFFTWKKI